jgi:hypothetical protein
MARDSRLEIFSDRRMKRANYFGKEARQNKRYFPERAGAIRAFERGFLLCNDKIFSG